MLNLLIKLSNSKFMR